MTFPTFWIWLVASESVGTKMGNLTAMAVKAGLAKPGTYQDGDGLFLKVKKSGGASWMVRVQRDGKGKRNGCETRGVVDDLCRTAGSDRTRGRR